MSLRGKMTLMFDMHVRVEEREGYFAASTRPFAITAYGNSEDKAERRAVEAVLLLLKKYSKTPDDMSAYLNRMGVKHIMYPEEALGRRHAITRESTKEVRLPVGA